VHPEDNPLIHVFERMVDPWGSRPIGVQPWYLSDASNDFTPYEFSVAFGREKPELRFMVEALGNEPTVRSNQCAAEALNQRLTNEFGVSLERLYQLEDLFFPDVPLGVFSAWHAVCWKPGGKPEFKIYLNLQVRGREEAPALLAEAMKRLGFAHAWRSVYGTGGRHGLDELVYFSLDLAAHQEARLKVYCRHHRATVKEFEGAARIARNHQEGDAIALCQAMADGESDGPFTRKPPITCYSFVDPNDPAPAAVTLHFPIAAYVPNDHIAQTRIERFITAQGLPSGPYVEMLRAFATRPLSAGRGLQSYASFRRDKNIPRVTVYFGPEAYSVAASAAE
jgi:DMATS type aromatic prenyltransferase